MWLSPTGTTTSDLGPENYYFSDEDNDLGRKQHLSFNRAKLFLKLHFFYQNFCRFLSCLNRQWCGRVPKCWRTSQPWTFQPQDSTRDVSTPDFSTMNFSTPWFKTSWLKSPRLKSSWLKSSWLKFLGLKSLGLKGPGLKGPRLKLGVEMSFHPKWFPF